MNNKEELSQREQYYMNKINKRDIVSPIIKGLRVLAFATLVPCTFYTGIGTAYGIKLNHDANQLKNYIELGQEDKADELIKDKFSSFQDEFAFYGLSREQQLEYIRSYINDISKVSLGCVSASLISMLCYVILSQIEHSRKVSNYDQLNDLIYQFYMDEKCRPELKEAFSDKVKNAIEDYGDFAPDMEELAKEQAKSLSFEDDVPFSYNNDYKMGFDAGELDCWKKYHEVAPAVSQTVLDYVNQNGFTKELDDIVADCSYQKGYHCAADVCKAIHMEKGETLPEEEQDAFFQEHDRPLEDSYSYWQGYCRGFTSMLPNVSEFAAEEYRGMVATLSNFQINSVDRNRIQSEFYRGLYNGVDEIEHKKEDESLSKS